MNDYPFPRNPSANDYCVFPSELENDPCVLFHATPSENFAEICSEGFKIPVVLAPTGLASVSFAKRSVGALSHAMMRRKSSPGEYVVFAVRYKSLDYHHISNNISDIHDYKLDPAPQIIGFCRIPLSYEHR